MRRRFRPLSWKARLLLLLLAAGGAVAGLLRTIHPATAALDVRQDVSLLAAGAPHFQRVLELYTGARIEPGNAVELLRNGDGTYPRLWKDLRAAQGTITLQSYYSQPGAVADTLATILKERARSGVRVLVLFDAFGSVTLGDDWLDSLRASGVRVALLRPLRWHTIHGAADRSHVRAVVVDGRIGYTGGFGLADYWQGNGHGKDQWRETNVRVEGPAALQLQAMFAAGWLEATGELITGSGFIDPDAAWGAGPAAAGVLYTTTTTGSTAAERFLVVGILSARRTLFITNSYFVPNADFRRLLIEAVARGVDVRILTAGDNTDVSITRYAGRHVYEDLLRNGVRIYEYATAMMHAKTMSVDGEWASVGSMNFDNRSLAFNDESTLLICDPAIASAADAMFFEDLRHARAITLDEFRQRSWWERALEVGADLVSALL
ncbi:MAG: phospholipase D-like domain-containing protein [Gemmatimonadaceae bacterium]